MHHLMLECVVAINIWKLVLEFFCIQIGRDYEAVARFWVSNSKNSALNSITSAALWCLWKSRNAIVFNNAIWLTIKQVWSLLLMTVRNWSILFQGAALDKTLDSGFLPIPVAKIEDASPNLW